MIAEQRLVALVPMRHQSERVPGKNYRLLADKPLYMHILDTLHQCSEIAEIVVDTDSPIIMQGISESYPQVRLIERPEHLRAADVAMNEVLFHDVHQIGAPFYLQTHSTNPLLRGGTISNAIAAFFDVFPKYDSLFSVSKQQARFWDTQGKPVNHDPSILVRTQDLTPFYEENSCIYIFEQSTFLARANRIGEKPFLYEVEREEAWDIDEELDFLIADFLMRERLRQE
ncbi:MAG: acylneuraminate cytidylyltransferase family protein [Anaerolineales bacterium]|nr:acylneuraminate cytidylyltransferase family protein [Anaerolineales bacterium]